MKLVILFALFALAAARVADFEPIDVEAEPTISIDTDKIREIAIRIAEFLRDLPPRIWPDWERPTSLPELEAVRDRIVELVQKYFPNGVPRPPKPSPNDVDDFVWWVQGLIYRLINSGLPRPPRPPPGTLENIKDCVAALPPVDRPLTLEGVIDWLQGVIACLPITRPLEDEVASPVDNVEDAEDIIYTAPETVVEAEEVNVVEDVQDFEPVLVVDSLNY